MSIKSLSFLGLIGLAVSALASQPPTTGAQFWSTNPNLDCTALSNSQTFTITLSTGGTGYVCIVSGTFPYFVAGGAWNTSLRMSSPASAPIGVDYTFYDATGTSVTLDTTSPNGAATGNEVNFALAANQASEVRLLDAPGKTGTQDGSVFAVFYCPDATTCATALPQLVYSNASPQWTLSVPIAWDTSFSPIQTFGAWTQWSATFLKDATHFITFAIYNQNTVATTYTVRVYDSTGLLVGQGNTPVIPGFSTVTQEGGTAGLLLSQVVTTPLPSGVYKVTIDGGGNFSSVSILQFSGNAATSLQVGYDTASTTATLAQPGVQPSFRRARLPSTVSPK